MRLTAYSRVSTAEQAREGISLTAQRSKMEAYALALDLTIVSWHEDALWPLIQQAESLIQ